MTAFALTEDWTHWLLFAVVVALMSMMVFGALYGWDRWHPIRWARNRIYSLRRPGCDWTERDPQLVGRHVRNIRPHDKRRAS